MISINLKLPGFIWRDFTRIAGTAKGYRLAASKREYRGANRPGREWGVEGGLHGGDGGASRG